MDNAGISYADATCIPVSPLSPTTSSVRSAFLFFAFRPMFAPIDTWWGLLQQRCRSVVCLWSGHAVSVSG